MRYIFFFLTLSIVSFNCQKELSNENLGPGTPTLTTTVISSITATTAISGGNISSDGGAMITARGVCWNTTANPVLTGSHTTDGSGIGTFLSNITGLNSGTTYHVRAYATNSAGTTYGNDISFTTSTSPGLSIPTITTTAISLITAASAISGGNISSDGGATVTARGACWSTSPAPGVTGNHTTDGSGIGTFISNITGLTANTVYYVRAYASNVAGTAYGNQLSFTTAATAPDVYIAGYEDDIGGLSIAKVWKNGIATSLTIATHFGFAYSVFVSGTDVYVAGSDIDGIHNSAAMVWKNGVATALTNGTYYAEARSVYISGTDIYVAGYESNGMNNVAKVWKNGIATSLTNGSGNSSANSVFVYGTDVYVAGSDNSISTSFAKVWKNGTGTSLTSGSSIAQASSVFVYGTDVYCAGSDQPASSFGYMAKMWKNGIASSLTNGSVDAFAESVFVAGTDVYVVGQEQDPTFTYYLAKVWKNGVKTTLTNGTSNSRAFSVFVK